MLIISSNNGQRECYWLDSEETAYWFCYLLMVSAFVVILLCRYQHEHLRRSITYFPLYFLTFSLISSIHFIFPCSLLLLPCSVSSVTESVDCLSNLSYPASPVILYCSGYPCATYRVHVYVGRSTKVCFLNMWHCVCVLESFVCACACAHSMCLQYLASASVLESPREYLPPGVTVSW